MGNPQSCGQTTDFILYYFCSGQNASFTPTAWRVGV